MKTCLPQDFESFLQKYLGKGLEPYLEDVESLALFQDVLKDLLKDTPVPETAIKLFVYLLPRTLRYLGQKNHGKRPWYSSTTARAILLSMDKLPYAEKIQSVLDTCLDEFLKQIKSRRAAEKYRTSKLSATAQGMVLGLPRDLQWHISQFDQLECINKRTELLAQQPPLRLKTIRDNNENRFNFKSLSVPLFGRSQQLEELDSFLNDEAPFSWWLVTGAAGSGKSRLGLELCLAHQGNWRAGFFPDSQAEQSKWTNTHDWRPSSPTLIIADYPHRTPKELHQLTRSLWANGNLESESPVRLLLLERETDTSWYNDFLGVGNSRGEILECAYNEAPLNLPLMSEQQDAVWDIISYFMQRENSPLPPKKETLAILKHIDKQMRPLFAMFMADALARKDPPNTWDKETLINLVLEKEKARWKACGLLDEPDIHLLTLASIIGKLEKQHLEIIHKTGLIQERWNKFPNRFNQVCKNAQNTIRGMEPDLLGELFVLNHINEAHKIKTIVNIREAAWTCNKQNMFSFLTRAAQDYPEHSALTSITACPENAEQHLEWAQSVVNIVGSTEGELPQRRYTELNALAQSSPKNQTLRLMQVTAAFNLILRYLKASNLKAASDIFEQLSDQNQKHSDKLEASIIQAQAATNLIHDYLQVSDFEAGNNVFKKLCKLAQSHPDDQMLRFIQANGFLNLINGYLEASDLVAASNVFEQLLDLAQSHPDEQELRLEQAKAAFNLIDALRTSDLEAAYSRFKQLCDLVQRYPNEQELCLVQAKAANNLIHSFSGSSSDFETAKELLEQLSELAQRHPDDQELRLTQAKATSNLFQGYLKASNLKAANCRLDQLSDLAESHPEEKELVLVQAIAVANLIDNLRTSDSRTANRRFDKLCDLAQRHPEDQNFYCLQASVATNLISSLGQSDLDAANKRFDELSDLAQRHPKEPKLRTEQARAALNLINSYLQASNLKTACNIYDELCGLAQRHPDEHGLRFSQAQAAFNLINRYLRASDLDAASNRLDELCDLASRHLDEQELQFEQAKATFNLIYGYLQASDLAAADNRLDQLCDLARSNPNDQRLRLEQAKAAYNLISLLGKSNLDAANSRFTQLCDLAKSHPNEEELRIRQVRTAVILIAICLEASDLNDASNKLDQLSTLAQGHPDEHEPQISYAYGLAVFATHHHKQNQFKLATNYCRQLAALSAEYPTLIDIQQVLSDLNHNGICSQ